MKISVLALLAAAALASAATNTTTTKPTSNKVTVTLDPGQAPVDAKKKPKADAKAAMAEPTSLVADSVDAATQIALEAAKAAQAEAAKLAAIGTDKAAPAAGKVAEAAVAGTVAATRARDGR